MRKITAVLAAVLVATFALGIAGYALALTPSQTLTTFSTKPSLGPTPAVSRHQGITGNATIEFVSPLCFPGQPTVPTTGPGLVITSTEGKITEGKIIVVSLSWSLVAGCITFAPIQVPLNPGTYSVTLAPCTYASCRSVLPITVNIQPGVYSPVVIRITTGIF